MAAPPYDFEGAGNGASATTATAELEITPGSGNSVTHDNTHVLSGGMALKMHVAATATCVARMWGTGVTGAVGTTFGTPNRVSRPRVWRWIPIGGYAAAAGGATSICQISSSSAASPLDAGTTALRMWALNKPAWAAQTTGITSATNVITQTATPVANGEALAFTAIGAATNINTNPGQLYYVINKTANTFQVALQSNGAAITLGTASGLAYKPAQACYVTDGPASHTSNTTGGVLTAVSQGSFDLVPFEGSGLLFRFELDANTANNNGVVHVQVSTNAVTPASTVVAQILCNNYNLGSGTITTVFTRFIWSILTVQASGTRDEWIDWVDMVPGGSAVDASGTPTPIYAPGMSAPTAPTASFTQSNNLPAVGTTVTYTSTSTPGSGGGSITANAWVFTKPDGTTVTSSGSAPAVAMDQDGQWNVQLTSTQVGGLTNTATQITYVHQVGAAVVGVHSLVTTYSNEGGAVDPVAALNDGGGANYLTYLLSGPDPVAVLTTITAKPLGDGPISLEVPGCAVNGVINRTVKTYKEDGVTLIHTEGPYALPVVTPASPPTATAAEIQAATVVHAYQLDTTAMTTLGTALTDRKALKFVVSDSI